MEIIPLLLTLTGNDLIAIRDEVVAAGNGSAKADKAAALLKDIVQCKRWAATDSAAKADLTRRQTELSGLIANLNSNDADDKALLAIFKRHKLAPKSAACAA